MKRLVVLRVANRVHNAIRSIASLGRKAKQNPLLLVLASVLIAALLVIGLICMVTIGPFVTTPGAILIDFVLLYFFLRVLVRVIVFPGSVVCWKRSTEQTFKTEISKQFSHHLMFLYSFLQQIAGDEPDKMWTFDKAGRGVNVLDTMVRNFVVQRKDRVDLNEQQQALLERASFITAALKKSQIWFTKEPNMATSLHSYLLAKIGNGNSTDMLGLSSVDGERSFHRCKDHIIVDNNEIRHSLGTLIAQLKDLHTTFKGNCFRRAQNFLAVPSIGSLHAIRAELSIRYNGEQMWIRGKKATLDAMYIPAGSGAEIASTPVVVYCNPNAGYYETLVYQSDTIDFYLTRGVSLMVFNYRGYGRSRGIPSPNAVREDGDLIVSHLFSLGCKQIGIHGRSIGGVAACFAAAKHPLAFCIADRTFSSLELTAKYTYGNWAEQGLRVCGASCDNTQNFVSISPSCVKIILMDPKDSIIPDFASLRTAVALHVASDRHFTEDMLSRTVQAYAFLECIFSICDPTERELRTVTFSNYDPINEPGQPTPDSGPRDWSDLRWLNNNEESVRTQISADFLALLREATDTFAHGLNAGGSTIYDALSSDCNAGDPIRGLECFFANLQVWGALPVEAPVDGNCTTNGVSHAQIYRYLDGKASSRSLEETEKILSPNDISEFYCNVAKAQVAAQKKLFRAKTATIARAWDSQEGSVLSRLAQDAVMEFDGFIAHIARYFKRNEIGLEGSTSDSSDDGKLPGADALTICVGREHMGYLIQLDCGHNGTIDSNESRQLAFVLQPTISRMVEEASLDEVVL